jgi:hypothetical protein
MILDAAHSVDIQNATPAFPWQTPSICVLQMDVQDTVLDVLDILRAQENPIFLKLPLTGDAFSRSEHFVALAHLFAENERLPFFCCIIPPQREQVLALATTYGIRHAPSMEDAFQVFEHVSLSHDAHSSPSLEPARSLPSPQTLPKTRQPLLSARKMALFLVISALLLPVMLLIPTRPTHPVHPIPAAIPVGTFSFESSNQFNPTLTQGYNDIVKLSLSRIPAPPQGFFYAAWLMPDPSDDSTVPLLLGIFHAESITVTYSSPDHTNLLARYSGVRITIQPANSRPETPSLDPKTWKWQGFLPNGASPGDEDHYSLLSHLRHLLARDPTLQANDIPGGLVLWLTQNVSKIEEWAGSAQGDWHGMQISAESADQIHRHLLRILEYLDGMFYYERDVPAGSPWIVDPLAGKIGLLDRVQNQQPPAFLVHVDIHLTGLANAPGHTMQQQQLAILIDTVITRMKRDLQQVRKDAALLVTMNAQQLRQLSNQAPLNEIAHLTSEVNSGWFDTQTGENIGGVLWMTSRLQQLASASVY